MGLHLLIQLRRLQLIHPLFPGNLIRGLLVHRQLTRKRGIPLLPPQYYQVGLLTRGLQQRFKNIVSQSNSKKAVSMKVTICISILFFVLYNPSQGDDKVKVTRLIDDAPSEFYQQVTLVYEKLGGTNLADLSFIAKSVVGVPDNRFVVSKHVKYGMIQKPQVLLIGNIIDLPQNGFVYLVCALYPYRINASFGVFETLNPMWIQGERRFDIWQMEKGVWKVILGVDLKSIKNGTKFVGNESNFPESPQSAASQIEQLIQLEKQVAKDSDELIKSYIDKKTD